MLRSILATIINGKIYSLNIKTRLLKFNYYIRIYPDNRYSADAERYVPPPIEI